MLRKLIPIVLVVAALAAVTSVSAATTTVSITKVGFVPATVTITTDDTIKWTNNDDSKHQVISQDAGFASPILMPGDSFSHTFTKAGTFSITDAFTKFKGTVTVTAQPSANVTLQSSSALVTYGRSVTLSGSLSSNAAGEKIDILKIECGSTSNAPERVATVTTEAGGNFSQLVRPLKNTRYVARFRSSTSDQTSVQVKPRITLGKISPRRYTVRVIAAQSFAGHLVVMQRFNRFTGTWMRVRVAVLRMGPEAIEPNEISTVTMTAKLRHRTRVRVVMTQRAVGACYLPGRSNVVIA
jgi:plastocyanin